MGDNEPVKKELFEPVEMVVYRKYTETMALTTAELIATTTRQQQSIIIMQTLARASIANKQIKQVTATAEII